MCDIVSLSMSGTVLLNVQCTYLKLNRRNICLHCFLHLHIYIFFSFQTNALCKLFIVRFIKSTVISKPKLIKLLPTQSSFEVIN